MLKQTKLKNGLTVLKVNQKDTAAVTVLLMCKVGSRYENKNINGVSHFVEHLMFKGTEKRPDTLTLSKELDKVGAEFNAFTSKEYTGYYIKVGYENQELALDMLSDMLFNSLFKSEEIDRERGVIIEEINMYEDNPLLYCDELLEKLIYRKDHPLGCLISGSRQNIKNMSRAQILNYKRKFYTPHNMVLAIAGRVNVKTNNLIKKYFDLETKNKKKNNYKKFTNYQTKPQFLIYPKKTEQIQIGLGFPSLGAKHKDIYALSLMNIILGGNMSSRLFINIREKQGLCYFIKSDIDTYDETGSFFVRAGLDKARIEQAIQAIIKELKTIAAKGVSKEELNKAKTYIKGKVSLDLEDSASQASWYGQQKLLRDELKSPKQKLALYNKVNQKDVLRAARKVIDFSKANLVLIGEFNQQEKNNIKRLFKI